MGERERGSGGVQWLQRLCASGRGIGLLFLSLEVLDYSYFIYWKSSYRMAFWEVGELITRKWWNYEVNCKCIIKIFDFKDTIIIWIVLLD